MAESPATPSIIVVAFAVNVGNLSPIMPMRRPMAELVDDLNLSLRASGQRMRVLDFFGHTGNFLLECGEQLNGAAQAIGRLLRTPCVTVDHVTACVAAVRTVPQPPAEAGLRWTPGVAFRITGPASSAQPTARRVAHLQPFDALTILAWKRDLEDSPGRLDRHRRAGGWGAVSSVIARQLGGVWTARSVTTLEGVLMRAKEPSVATGAGITSH